MLAIRKGLAYCALAALSALPLAASGVNIIVNSVQDPNTLADGIGGGCTLRKALFNAINGAQTFTDCIAGSASADVITFTSSTAIPMGTIGAFPDITKDITLTGPKTITGNGSDSIFRIASSGTLRLTDFTLTNAGNSAIQMAGLAHLSVNVGAFNNNTTGACCGGAIGGDGTISLINVTFDSNTAPSGSGGAIHLNGKDLSTITDATFTNNSANIDGGAIYVSLVGSLVSPANLTILNGLFASNKASASGGATHGGGAIYSSASGVAAVSIFNATFINNEVDGNDGRGGAIHNAVADSYPMIVDHVVFGGNKLTSNNLAIGGAIFTADNIVVRASSFILNDAGAGKGGAIASNAAPPDNSPTPPEPGAVIANSTIQGNLAAIGGAIYNYGQFGNKELKLINVTLDGNTATGQGGGIFTENIGGGTAITRLANTIVSNNLGGGVGDNCFHVGNPVGNPVNNIVGNLQFPGATCLANPAITTGDPKLDPPFINLPDVLTLTMSLKAGSAAIGAGDNATCASLPIMDNFDQRSLAAPIRPLPGGSNCDSGAYESSRAPVYGSTPAPGSTITINTFTFVPATATVTISEDGDNNLTVTSYPALVAPLSVAGTVATPFNLDDGSGATETLTLTCSSGVPATSTQTLSVNHNATGSPATYTVICNVVAPLSITTATPMPAGTVGVAYSQTFAATGGTVPYVNWAVTAGSLPPPLALDAATGALTGMPSTTVGSPFGFTIRVTDTNGITATKAFTLAVNAALVITTATPMPAGTVGVAYNQTFAATGGTAPYVNWAVTVGALPPGLSLDATTGALTGPPGTAVGSPFSFTIQVTDTNGITATKAFTLAVNPAPLVITTATPMPAGTVGVAYSQTFAATGGTAPYVNWAVTVGTLPPLLVLDPATGALTGTPTTAGPFSFTIQVTDTNGITATKAFTLTVNAAALVITTATPLPSGTVGVAYNQTFAATGGTAPYVSWAVTVGAPPPGLSLNVGTGALTGPPGTAVGSPFSFTIQVTDTNGITATKAFTLAVNPAPLVITTATPMPAGTVGVAYNQTFAATGGTAPYVNWAVTVGALPPGLSLNAGTGALTGPPGTAVGSPFSFTIQVTDTNGITATKAFTLAVNPAPLVITTATPMPSGTVGVAYNQTFAATGGTAPYVNWAVTVGALPPGLSLNAGTGALTGPPGTAIGSPFSFTIQVTDTNGITATKAFTLAVNAAPLVITTATPLPSGTVGLAYSQTFAASGGTAPYVNWAVTVGSLPPGLALNAGTGALTGPPGTAVGSPFSFTIQVTDTNGITATKAFTLPVNASLTITTATPLPAGTVGVAYSQTFAATGGTAPYVNWAVTVGSLPPGLSLNAGTGALTGPPGTAVGSPFSFTIQVTDTNGITATKAFTLTVNPSSLSITTPTPLPPSTVGVLYAQSFAAAGGTAPYVNWAVTVGSLPPGLALGAATGTFNGISTTPGTYNFTVQVTDTAAATATKAFSLTINAAPTVTTPTPLPNGTTGTPYNLTFAATGGTPPYPNWFIAPGTLPPGLSYAAGTGVLSGTPTTPGTYNFSVQVIDSVGASGTKAFALTIGAASTCFTGPSASGSGSVQSCVAGGGPTCTYAPGSAQFIPVTGNPLSPPAGTAPAGIVFPHGLFTFSLSGCTPGSSVTLTVTYPAAIPAGAQYWKYGPQPPAVPAGWYVMPATIVGNTATFTITDGGLGDDDLVANGSIVDQGGPGVPGAPGAGAVQTPTLSELALILLAMITLAIGMRRTRRRGA